jgi:FtsP/CotA-like multicopper oxidase with cupredoxin domain
VNKKTKTMMRIGAICAGAFAFSSMAIAQIPFPQNYPSAPTGAARQDVFPYPGQCTTGGPGFGFLPNCNASTNAKSFACEPSGSGFSNQTAGTFGTCGSVTHPKDLGPVDPTTQAKFQFEVLNPPDYTPDTSKFLNADFYDIAVHESWGFQGIASAGLFPNPTVFTCGSKPCMAVPDGMQWTGLVCTASAGCSCPSGVSSAFASAYCSAGGKVPFQQPLFTPIWGVGQKNMGGGPVTTVLSSLGLFKPPARSPEWSRNNFVATWPSISIRGTKGRPVVVKWENEFPNNHLFCPHPEAADWPCAIDRTFMGVRSHIDPATAPPTFQLAGIPFNGVNQFGGAQQPDNSWVTHLHGGDIPPQTDGFAEKWYGNVRSGRYYSPQPWLLNPAFDAPKDALPNHQVLLQYGAIFRPGGDPRLSLLGGESSWMYDTYAYPMVNDEATIWFHDHTLGKTHHNVIAGPAGFFPVKDPSKHGKVVNGKCKASSGTCDYTWIDPVTEPRNSLGIPLYDLFLAVQDRSFNDDGSLNFPTGMSQPLPLPVTDPVADAALQNPNDPAFNCLQPPPSGSPPTCLAPGTTTITPGPNPQVHPTWVPEYFADHALVNGVIWPKKTVAPGWYRVRLVDGSDSRCYNFTFGRAQGAGNGLGLASRGLGVQGNDEAGIQVYVIATDQGYLPKPTLTDHITICPGERFEFLIDFSPFAPGTSVFMNNNAAAPFPDGVAPQDPGSPFTELATIMRFDVVAPGPVTGPAVPSCSRSGLSWDPAKTPSQNGVGCIALPALDPNFSDITNHSFAAERVLYLNERVDGVTGSSLGLQINGVPFEYDVTETPRKGTYEVWHIVNTTVDAHPIHPHLVKHQIVKRETFDTGCYKTLLCGSPTCQPGPAGGGIPVLTPDYHACLTGGPTFISTANGVEPYEAGWKDATKAYPGEVLTIIAKWEGGWAPQVAAPNAPGSGNSENPGFTFYQVGGRSPNDARQWSYAEVTQGPYVWHCHINSHEDSEMMRSSLVVK